MSEPIGNNEIKTFKDFLDKINLLPSNPKFTGASAGTASSASAPIKGASINPPPAKPTNLTLTLKPIRGDPQSLRLPFTQSVGDLRAKVAQLFQISEVDRCRLIRGGKALSDDKQSVEAVFGVVSDPQILHVLEKPPTVSGSTPVAASPSTPASTSTSVPLKSADHKIWSQIGELLQSEAEIVDEKERSIIIEKFRKSLD